MHATVQPGGRSPKPSNGPTSTSQLKSDSDDVQSATSFASQAKGKKRERSEQSSEPLKRERASKTDDIDSGQLKPESILKSEIAKITEKGGLVDSEGVEKLVQLMQPDRAERKMELICRSMLVGVIASTENFDCLTWFVQLRGLPVLDEWLQDVHKGKIGDGGSPKDGDKSVEEFLFVLLRALDKLPVNLHALQMCNIGKSVNNLRTHKNLEIQKKARSLVDTWKKRVQAEMNIIEAKSGSTQAVSWSSRSRIPEVPHGGNRHPGGSSEVATKSSVTQLSAASKTASVKPLQVEITAVSASSSPGTTKSALSPPSGKDGQPRYAAGSTSDLPSTMAREEKSSSSSQSHNNSQSCSSDHGKTIVFSGKEDARNSTAGSMSVNKSSGGGSRHRRTNNGFPVPAGTGVSRESGSNSSLHRNSERTSQSALTCEKALDVPFVEGSSHKLIVKIPNRGRSPAQSASGGSFEDPTIKNSRASSPVLSEKHDQFDRNSKEMNDTYRANVTSDVNTESWQSNDFKDVLTGSDEGDGSPAAVPNEERCMAGDNIRKPVEVSKVASSSSGNELKSGKLHEASFSSINALIESCVKYSEADASMSVADDVGMDLLASVAASEMSKSDFISPTDSPHRNTPIADDSSTGDDVKAKSSRVDASAQDQSQFIVGIVEKQGVIAATSCSEDGLHRLSKLALADFSADGKSTSSLPGEIPAGEDNVHSDFSIVDLKPSAVPCSETNEKPEEMKGAASVALPLASTTEKVMDGEGSKELYETKAAITSVSVSGTKLKGSSSLSTNKVNEVLASVEVVMPTVGDSSLLSENNKDNKNVDKVLNSVSYTEQKQSPVLMHPGRVEKSDKELLCPADSGSGKDLTPGSINEFKTGKADEMDSGNHINQNAKEKTNHETSDSPTIECKVGVESAVTDQKNECMESTFESKEVAEHHSGGTVPHKEPPALSALGTEQHMRPMGSKLTGAEADETEECRSNVEDTSDPAAGTSDMDSKAKFDLNDIADDGKYGEPMNLAIPGCSAPVHLITSLPFPVSSSSSGLPSSITVAAAAKGPFVPPEDLLRNKGELGWKGSAATSAFRPAEPRKVLEMPLSTTSISLRDATASKHGRPPLDIDLNVPDERVLEDMASRNTAQETGSTSDHINNYDLARNDLMCSAPLRSTGGLDLDLNQIDEANDMGQYSTSSSHRVEAQLLLVKSPSSSGYANCEVRRDFDLNNGPLLDEGSSEPSSFNQHGRSSMQSQAPVPGLRMKNAETGHFSSWFPRGSIYTDVTIPSMLPDRGDQPVPIIATGGPPRMLGPPIGGTPFTPDVYRGSVLSSSHAMPFPSSHFQYPVFPFGNSFTSPSATFSGGSTTYMDSSSGGRLCFPPGNSQLLGPVGGISSQFQRPYVVSLPEGSNNVGGESNRKWGRQGLDLNAGPASMDVEGRFDSLPLASGQLSVASSQVLAEEQARMYQMAGAAALKRKEPEGGWNSEGFRYKQSSWQ
ncbi:uncharacterized protein LOC132283104 isoform X2 [Cornus florida]|nr:uncharacterized protein LOC132283104 isoform X2 [Cornus florida]